MTALRLEVCGLGHGPKHRALYLAYAESCGEKLDRQAVEAPGLNAFELDIRDTLEKAGVPLICQHGVGRYRLDFAAKHPDQPGDSFWRSKQTGPATTPQRPPATAIDSASNSSSASSTARDPERITKRLLAQLEALGHTVTLQEAAAA